MNFRDFIKENWLQIITLILVSIGTIISYQTYQLQERGPNTRIEQVKIYSWDNENVETVHDIIQNSGDKKSTNILLKVSFPDGVEWKNIMFNRDIEWKRKYFYNAPSPTYGVKLQTLRVKQSIDIGFIVRIENEELAGGKVYPYEVIVKTDQEGMADSRNFMGTNKKIK